MWILIIYILIVVVGQSVVVGIRSGLGSNFPLGEFASVLDVILRCARVGSWTEPKHAKRAKHAS